MSGSRYAMQQLNCNTHGGKRLIKKNIFLDLKISALKRDYTCNAGRCDKTFKYQDKKRKSSRPDRSILV